MHRDHSGAESAARGAAAVTRLRAALRNPRFWAALAVVAGSAGVAISPELRDALAVIAGALLE